MMLQHGLSEDSSYTVNQSLRFRAGNSAYLSRTPSSNGDSTKITMSAWVKRGKLGSAQGILSAGSAANNATDIYFNAGDNILVNHVVGGGSQGALVTTAVFRDPSAHLHVVAVIDLSLGSPKFKIYVNGVQQSATESPAITATSTFFCNTSYSNRLGYSWLNSTYLDGYLSEINFVDGQALDPSAFGQVDAVTGIWVPKKYTGTYGNNGFYLPFNDATSLTTLGYDRSGNGNNWTCNGVSITAGATYDVMKDSPTNGLNEVGNYCTSVPSSGAGTGHVSRLNTINGNLDVGTTAGAWFGNIATMSVSNGKWYWEVTTSNLALNTRYAIIGVANSLAVTEENYAAPVNTWCYFSNSGNKSGAGASTAYGTAYYTGTVTIGVALDCDTGTLTFYNANTSQGVAFSSGLVGVALGPWIALYGSGAAATQNFGQRPFTYTPPTGFKALHTGNLPDATPVTTSGTFTGNASTDGPCVFINGTPTAMTINGNAVTFATHADKLAGGFKVRSSSASYNTAGTNTYSITTNSGKFKNARAQANP